MLEPVLAKPAFRRQPTLTNCAEFYRTRLSFATEETESNGHNRAKKSTESHPCGSAATRGHSHYFQVVPHPILVQLHLEAPDVGAVSTSAEDRS